MAASALLVCGLGWGDEGKGSIVDYLTRRHGARLVVRHNGGAQAAHNVVTDDGRHHTFAQFGSGTLAGAETFLSRYMLVNPIFMLAEARHLAEIGVSDPLALVRVDRRALITTPYHVALNRLKELARGGARHGSCGMGIGETVEWAAAHPHDALRAEDCFGPTPIFREKLAALRERIWRAARWENGGERWDRQVASEEERRERDILTDADDAVFARTVRDYEAWAAAVRISEPEWLAEALRADGTVIFEGAQGVLLDQDHGFHPHTTWSDCTFGNAERLFNEAEFRGEKERIGVTRAYATRHGVGPFPTEVPGLTFAGEHNALGPWQGAFRCGWLDLPLLRYAADACGGVDVVAVTCLDQLRGLNVRVCVDYKDWAPRATRWPVLEAQARVGNRLAEVQPVYHLLGDLATYEAVSLIEEVAGPCTIRSFGPRAADKKSTSDTRRFHAPPF